MASKFVRNVTDIDKDKVPEYPESMVVPLDLLSDKNERAKIYIYRGKGEFFEITDAVKVVNGNVIDENNTVEVDWTQIPKKPFETINDDDFEVVDGELRTKGGDGEYYFYQYLSDGQITVNAGGNFTFDVDVPPLPNLVPRVISTDLMNDTISPIIIQAIGVDRNKYKFRVFNLSSDTVTVIFQIDCLFKYISDDY